LERHNFTAIVPCLNEESTIEMVVLEIRKVMKEAVIVVIDNGSTDRTNEIARGLSCQVLEQPNPGKGNAFRLAINNLNSDIFFMVDGDNTYSLDNLNEAISMVSSGTYDMVIGRRVSKDYNVKSRSGHDFGNWFFTKITNLFFHHGIEDSLSGFRVMNAGFVKSFQGGNSKFELEVELNTHARVLGSNVGTVETLIRSRPEGSISKLSTFSDGFRIISRLVQLFKNEKPMVSFLIFALPWFLVSFLAIENVLRTFFATKEIANFPSLIGGVGCFIVGINLWGAGLIVSRIQMVRRDLSIYAYREFQGKHVRYNGSMELYDEKS
jgi:glycosyltransferase involved in cell wall biosynthesis